LEDVCLQCIITPKPKILIALFKEEDEKLIVRRKKIDFDK